MTRARREISAGILLYRFHRKRLEFLLGHPGGPYYRRKIQGCWSIPKGNVDPGEDITEAALREFREETGIEWSGPLTPIGEVRYSSGKTVHAFGGEWMGGRLPELTSTLFEMEWPPKSGRMVAFPEFDRIGFYSLHEARRRIIPAQAPFLGRLAEIARTKLKNSAIQSL